MRRDTLILACMLAQTNFISAQVAINTDASSPDNSSILDVKSITKGMLAPRMTESDRLAIGLPANGLLVYQINNTPGFYYNSGTDITPNWTYIGLTGTSNFLAKYNGTVNGGASLLYDDGLKIGIGTTTPIAKFEIQTTVSGTDGLAVYNTGTGKAGIFTISNASNTGNALEGNTNGTGYAGAFFGSAYIRGKGTTNSTTALYIANSSNSPLLKIFDNGNAAIGSQSALNFGGYLSVGPLTNKRGLTISSGPVYAPDAPAVLELIGSTDNVGEEVSMIDFITQTNTQAYFNNARIAVVREDSNPAIVGIAFYTRLGAAFPERMRITNNGNIGIGCTSPIYKLHVVGDITAQNGVLRASSAIVNTSIIACSDIRYKKDIQPLVNVLPQLVHIQGVGYRFRRDEFPERYFPDSRQIGFIAHEVEKYFPEVVVTEKDGYKALDYSRFAPLLLEAIKEQQSIIDQQRIRLEKAEAETKALRADLEKLKTILCVNE